MVADVDERELHRPELRQQAVHQALDSLGLGFLQRLEDVEDQPDGVLGLPCVALLHVIDAPAQRAEQFLQVVGFL
jgi:hypothetical protein